LEAPERVRLPRYFALECYDAVRSRTTLDRYLLWLDGIQRRCGGNNENQACQGKRLHGTNLHSNGDNCWYQALPLPNSLQGCTERKVPRSPQPEIPCGNGISRHVSVSCSPDYKWEADDNGFVMIAGVIAQLDNATSACVWLVRRIKPMPEKARVLTGRR